MVIKRELKGALDRWQYKNILVCQQGVIEILLSYYQIKQYFKQT